MITLAIISSVDTVLGLVLAVVIIRHIRNHNGTV